MSKRAKAALASGLGVVALVATYLAGPWEGKENLAYYDRLGKVWTVCYGETKDVKAGDRHNDQDCLRMLYDRLERDYRRPLAKCIGNFDTLPLSLQASLLDAGYNLGADKICKSTAAERAMAKNYRGACEAVAWFNRAAGKVIEGLKRRREYGDATRIGELELCLAGL